MRYGIYQTTQIERAEAKFETVQAAIECLVTYWPEGQEAFTIRDEELKLEVTIAPIRDDGLIAVYVSGFVQQWDSIRYVMDDAGKIEYTLALQNGVEEKFNHE